MARKGQSQNASANQATVNIFWQINTKVRSNYGKVTLKCYFFGLLKMLALLYTLNHVFGQVQVKHSFSYVLSMKQDCLYLRSQFLLRFLVWSFTNVNTGIIGVFHHYCTTCLSLISSRFHSCTISDCLAWTVTNKIK